MALTKLNRARMTTATVGTGAITPGAAVSGYQSFAAAGAVNGTVFRYVIEDGSAWEYGDATYSTTGPSISRSRIGSSTGSLLSLSGTAEIFCDVTAEDFKAPTRQVFTSGSGTYTTPSRCRQIRVRLMGGGGGGAGSGTSAGNGGAGGNTTFDTLTAGGGGAALGAVAGSGGTATGGDFSVAGGDGGRGSGLTNQWGGEGGISAFGGAGTEGQPNQSAGTAAKTNSGSGGGGAGCGSTVNSGAGGGAGAYLEKIIDSPASSYSYSVGAGGSAGTAGTGGSAGGAGGSGLIIIDEFY